MNRGAVQSVTGVPIAKALASGGGGATELKKVDAAGSYPVSVQQGAGATYGSLATLVRRGRAASVSGTGLDRTVTVDHSAGTAFVPLRATAADDRRP
jgi:hypothetical protein